MFCCPATAKNSSAPGLRISSAEKQRYIDAAVFIAFLEVDDVSLVLFPKTNTP